MNAVREASTKGEQAASAPSADQFRHWIEDHVRFADLDPLGHCNNAAISGFFESARVALLAAAGHPIGTDGVTFSIVHQSVDYYRELRLDARLRIGTRVAKLGRTSVTLANAVFEGESCAASATIIGVTISLATRRPVELPSRLRAGLAAYA